MLLNHFDFGVQWRQLSWLAKLVNQTWKSSACFPSKNIVWIFNCNDWKTDLVIKTTPIAVPRFDFKFFFMNFLKLLIYSFDSLSSQFEMNIQVLFDVTEVCNLRRKLNSHFRSIHRLLDSNNNFKLKLTRWANKRCWKFGSQILNFLTTRRRLISERKSRSSEAIVAAQNVSINLAPFSISAWTLSTS